VLQWHMGTGSEAVSGVLNRVAVCVAVYCSVTQYNAVCCSVLQCVAVLKLLQTHLYLLKRTLYAVSNDLYILLAEQHNVAY